MQLVAATITSIKRGSLFLPQQSETPPFDSAVVQFVKQLKYARHQPWQQNLVLDADPYEHEARKCQCHVSAYCGRQHTGFGLLSFSVYILVVFITLWCLVLVILPQYLICIALSKEEP